MWLLVMLACNGLTDDEMTDDEPVVEDPAPALRDTSEVMFSADDGLSKPTALGFHPDDAGQLWIVNHESFSATIVSGIGTDDESTETKIDSAAGHFMVDVSSMAWGDMTEAVTLEGTNEQVRAFGTCQDNNKRRRPPATEIVPRSLHSLQTLINSAKYLSL